MKAMVLKGVTNLKDNRTPLEMADVPKPVPGAGQILIKVLACGVCHTEMDEIEGRTAPPRFPVIPGHQVVGRVEELGPGAGKFEKGRRVGVAWIFSSCGHCKFCERGLENLCPDFRATGRDADGGYAEYMTVHEDYAYPIPEDGVLGQEYYDLNLPVIEQFIKEIDKAKSIFRRNRLLDNSRWQMLQ